MSCPDEWKIGNGASSCRTLDFNLAFSSAFLSIAPAACFILGACVLLFNLTRKNAKDVCKGGVLLNLKMAAASVWVIADLLAIIAWCTKIEGSSIGVGACVVAFLASLCAALLSHLDHRKTVRPHILLSVYLLVVLVFDIARIRTFSLLAFPTQHTFYFATFIISFGSKVVLLALENVSKRSCLLDPALKHSLSQEATSGLISQLLLLYLYPLLALGRKDVLTNENIGVGEHPGIEQARLERFQSAWKKHQAEGSKHLLLRSLFAALKKDILAPALSCILGAVSNMVSPLLIRAVALFLASWRSDSPQPVEYGWALSAAYFIYPIVNALLLVWFTMSCARLAANARGLLMQVVYRHAVRVHTSVAEDMGSGALSSFMTLDVSRITDSLTFPYLCIQLTIGYVLGLLVMAREFGRTTTIAVLILILANTIGMPLLAKRQISSQALWSKASDARVKLISSIISCFKATKMQGYESALHQKYDALRSEELKQQAAFLKTTMPVNFTTNMSVGAFRLAMLVTYATVCYLDPPRALDYVSILVGFAVVEQWGLFFFVWGSQFTKASSAISSIQRIENFLLQDEHPAHVSSNHTDNKDTEEKESNQDIVLDKATFGIKSKQTALLHDISTVCKARELTVILGETSSGKSCLLQAMLGELDLLSGGIQFNSGTLAFCSQNAFLLPKVSVRDSILFSRPFDQSFYRQVLAACDLEVDISHFTEGDQRPCAALSGGQRQRVALARSLYAHPDTLVLDEIFSALDRKTEAHVYNSLFGIDGLRQGKTTILATNALHLVQAAPHLLYMKNGRLSKQGTYAELSSVLPDVAASKSSAKDDKLDVEKTSDPPEVESARSDQGEDEKLELSSNATFQALKTHVLAAGMLLILSLSIVAIITWSWKAIGYLFFVKAWAGEEYIDQRRHFGAWTAGFIMTTVAYLALILLYIHIYILWVPIKASKTLHRMEIKGLLGTAASFVQDKSVGYLTNRFSSDVYVHETEFSFHSAKVVQWSIFVACQSLVCFIAIPYAVIIFVAMLLAGESARRYFSSTGHQLRQLESASLTPLYNAIASASDPDCLRVVRASKMETTLEKQVDGAVRFAKQPFYLLAASRQWLFSILSLFLSIMSCVMVLVAVVNRTEDNGVLALALISALTIPNDLSQLLIQFTDMQIASISIQRMAAIANLPAEVSVKEDVLQSDSKSLRCAGGLEFKDVTLKYSDEAEPALDRVSFKISPGRKVGICGRSGSGKSTLLSCLFRLLPLSDGQILVDGQDINSCPLYDWRRSLTVIPQEPMLLDLTIRENLDLGAHAADHEIWSALDKVGCKALIQALPGQLDHAITHGGLSRGTKQLSALARAILRDSKIVCLDESTASLDLETDQKIAELLRTEFKDATVLCVAHRISSIMKMDEILVLHDGRIAERGTPVELLAANGLFAALAGELKETVDGEK